MQEQLSKNRMLVERDSDGDIIASALCLAPERMWSLPVRCAAL